MKSTPSKWRTIGSKTVYENPWITVQEDQVINPSGNSSIYGKVMLKNHAVAILPLDQYLYTWIVGQHRYTLNEYSWELPMGGVPLHQNLIEGAKRELLEETGITAGKWTQLLKMHTSNSITDEVAYSFLAEDISQGQPQFEETEDLQIKRLPLKQVVDMVMQGAITDNISVATVLKLARLMGF